MDHIPGDPAVLPLLRVLIVDDDRSIRLMLALCLEEAGHTVVVAGTKDEAAAELQERVYDLAFIDLRLGEQSGIDLLKTVQQHAPWVRMVMMTAYGTIESAVESIRLGAIEYLLKPFDCSQVRALTARYAELIGMQRQLERQTAVVGHESFFLESTSPAMQRALEHARAAAASEATVLITGESGTGKTLLARSVHEWSSRASGPFVTVSCPTLPDELFESELFGHQRGAFTGAIRDAHGRVAEADGGTLFLDEIGEIPVLVQSKLLRFLQDKTFERVGDSMPRTANIRLIAATNRSLETAIVEGTFREDLYYRLNVITLALPSLRERPEDILAFAERFLHRFAIENKREIHGISAAARQMLLQGAWNGNVRELRNAIERAVILGTGPVLEAEDLSIPTTRYPRPPAAGDAISVEMLEHAHIRAVLSHTSSLQDAASILGIDQATLWRKRKQYGLD
ncbi:MAG: sigma-54-dependent Fis family transcriptional regulator [Bacteroidetes bacterium]|nr:sigma-54-dependent Fis family transcriptional regulator [Bacteroidota bacterium]